MSAVKHFTEYVCERCKGVERRPYGASPPPAWRWFGHGAYAIDGTYSRGLLCGHCDKRLRLFLDGYPIDEGEAEVEAC